MRVAKDAYHLDEGACVVDVPPTWRDWLFVGLSADACDAPLAAAVGSNQLKPQNTQDRLLPFRPVETTRK